jgi:hypothetical protein
MSSDYEWNLARPERTVYGFQLYDIQKAKQIIVNAPRPVQAIDLEEHGEALQEFLDEVKFSATANWDSVNLDVPVIVIRNPEAQLVIDGRHRLRKALDERRPILNAIYLTDEERNAIRLA